MSFQDYTNNNSNNFNNNDNYFKSGTKNIAIKNNSSNKKNRINKHGITKINEIKTPTSTSANRVKKGLTVNIILIFREIDSFL